MSSEIDTGHFVDLPLDEACELITDGTHHSPQNGPTGEFRYVTAKNIKRGRLDLSETSFVTKNVHDDIYSRCPAKQGDILFIKDGATAGIAAINTLEDPISLLSSVALLRPKFDLLDGQFLCHWLNSPEIVQRLAGEMTGSAIRRIILRDIRSAIIRIPPLPEQRRIVAKLDALQSRTGIAREALDGIAPLLKSFRQSVLQTAVTGALTEEWRSKQRKLPEWESVVVGDLLLEKPRNGYSPRSVDRETKVKSLSLSATTSGRFRPECFKYIDESIPDDSHLWLRPGDILIQRANTIEYVGVSAIFDGPEETFIYPDLMMKCRANSRTSPHYLHILLSSSGVRQFYWDNATGTAGNMPKINQSTVMSAPVELPPLAKQTEIVRRVRQLFAMADAMEAEFAAAQRSVDQLDQSLLATAFRGELVPQDPSDEPASALLERIRAARAALPEPKGKRGRKASSDFDASLLMAAEPVAPKKRGRPRKN